MAEPFNIDPYLATKIAADKKISAVTKASADKKAVLTEFANRRNTDGDNAFNRSIVSLQQSVGIAGSMIAGDNESLANQLKIAAEYRRMNPSSQEAEDLYQAYASGTDPNAENNLSNGIDAVGRGFDAVGNKIVDDFNTKGAGSLVDNASAMAGGVVSQLFNMVPPLVGMGVGAAAGSLAGPAGTIAGSVAGATLGNAVVGAQEAAGNALNKAGINPLDSKATEAYLNTEGNLNNIIKENLIKSAVIGVVDTATMKLGSAILAKPAELAVERGLAKLGIDVADTAAVNAAKRSGALKAVVDADPEFLAAKSGVLNQARNTGVFALEPAGEIVGEGVGNFAATGELDVPGAVLEGLSSLGQSGATFAGQKVFDAINSPLKDSQLADDVNPDNAAVQAQAVATGNISQLTNPKLPTYNPVKAIAALYGNSQLDTAIDDVKETNLNKANQVIADLEDRREAVLQAIEPLAKREADLEIFKEKLNNLSPDNPKFVQLTKLYNIQIAAQEDRILKGELSPQLLEQQTAVANQLNKDITDANKALGIFNDFVTNKRDTTGIIEEANQPVVPESNITGSKVVSLAMRSPESLSIDDVNKLISNTDNALSTQDREYLTSFVNARTEEASLKTLGNVSKEILYGSEPESKNKYVGIANYRAAVMAAIGVNNESKANKELAQLENFSESHQNKLNTILSAKAQYDNAPAQRNKPPVKIGAMTNGKWEIADENKTYDRTEFISDNSTRLIKAVTQEVKTINAALTELDSAYKNKFTPKSNENTTQKPVNTSVSEPKVNKPTAEGVAPLVAVNDSKAKQVAEPVIKTAPEAIVEAKNEPEIVKNTDKVITKDSENISGLTALNEGKNFNKANNYSINNMAENFTVEYNGKELTTTVYQLMNRAAAFLTQKTNKGESAEDVSASLPLVDITNLVDGFTSENPIVEITDFFPAGVNETEESAVNNFFTIAKNWQAGIVARLTNSNQSNDPRFKYVDPIQDLLVDGQVQDNNLATAIAYGAYTYFKQSASGGAINTKEAILKIHGLQERDGFVVTDEGYQELKLVAGTVDFIRDQIGGHIINALGLKAKKNAPINYLPALRIALGTHGLEVLIANDLMENKGKSLTELNSLIVSTKTDNYFGSEQGNSSNNEDVNLDEEANTIKQKRAKVIADNTVYHYVQFTRDSKLALKNPIGKQIIDLNKGASGIVDTLFTSQKLNTEVSLEPIPYRQKFYKNTKQTVATNLTKVLKKLSNTGKKAVPEMVAVAKFLGNDTILTAAGFVQDLEGSLQAEKRAGAEAKNNSLLAQMTDVDYLLNANPLEQVYYTAREAWRNSRVGIASSMLNEQSSKIVRNMFANDSWQSTIDLANPEAVDLYKLSIAQNLGIKTDTQANDKTLLKFENQLVDIKEYLDTIKQGIADPDAKISAEGKQKIGEFAAANEGMSTLQALTSLAYFQNAVDAYNLDNTKSEFKTTVLVGVDGKANGPMLTLLSLGASDSSTGLFNYLQRGGFYSKDSGVKNFNNWTNPVNADIYADLTKLILARIKNPKANEPAFNEDTFIAINILLKELVTPEGVITSAGRSLGKAAQTAFNFGSSIKSSRQGLAKTVLESLYDRIEGIHLGTEKSVSINDLIEAVNLMMPSQKLALAKSDSAEDMAIRAAELFNTEFTPAQKNAFMEGVDNVIGDAVGGSLQDYYGDLITRRNVLNQSVQIAQQLYKQAFVDLRNAEIERLMDEKVIAAFTDKSGKRVPLFDLNTEQEANLVEKIKGLLPLTHTIYSQETGDISSGKLMTKSNTTSGTNYFDTVKVGMGETILNAKGKPTKSVAATSRVTTDNDIGVGGVAALIHSLDSYIMHMVIGDSFNGHDEIASSINNVIQNAKNINQSVWNALVKYSPLDAAFNTLESTVLNLVPLIESKQLSAETLASFKQIFVSKLTKDEAKSVPADKAIEYVLGKLYAQAYQADGIKLETLVNMGSIDQYTWEGGEYTPTDTDIADAKAALAKHTARSKTYSKATADAISSITKAINTTEAESTFENTNEVEEVVSTKSVFGSKGNPAKPVNTALVNLFKNKPTIQVSELLTNLESITDSAFNKRLLTVLAKTINPALTINVIGVNTPESYVVGKPDFVANAWYNGQGNGQIYILNEDFVSSGMSVEVVLHELIHAATKNTIDNASNKITQSVDELNDLRTRVSAYLAQNKSNFSETEFKVFTYASSDIYELIAFGMSNANFQQQVLNNVDVPTATVPSKGLAKFIQIITDLLMGDWGKNTKIQKGMENLIKNTSIILEQSTKEINGIGNTQSSAMASPTFDYTTYDIFNAIEDTNNPLPTTFQSQLKKVITSIVFKLHGPLGTIKDSLMQGQAGTALNVWYDAMATLQVPFASNVLASGFKVSDQEAFVMDQVEATVIAALETADTSNTMIYRQLAKLYKEAAATIKLSDFHQGNWATATQLEIDKAQSLYDYIFDGSNKAGVNERKNYLSRFVAFGLANKEFNALLNFDTKINDKKAIKFVDRLQEIFENILSFFQEKATNTYKGERANDKLEALVQTLITIEAKRRLIEDKKLKGNPLVDNINGKAQEVGKGISELVVKLASADIIKNSKFSGVRATGDAARVIAEGRIESTYDYASQIRDKMYDSQIGIIAGIANDVRGPEQQFEDLLVARKLMETTRSEITSSMKKSLLNAFNNRGEDLVNDDKVAITKLFLDTGAHVLLDTMTISEIKNIVDDNTDLANAINLAEQELTALAPSFKNDYIHQANTLAYGKVHGINLNPWQLKNAYNIARLLGTPKAAKINASTANKAAPIINKLTALYAISYSRNSVRERATKILDIEIGKTNGEMNGVEYVLYNHKKMEKDALEKLFDNNPTLMEHGYTPDILHPNKGIQVADEIEGLELIAQGYVKSNKELLTDPDDTNKTAKHLYVIADTGTQRRVSGSIALNSMGARGSQLFEGTRDPSTKVGRENAKTLKDFTDKRTNTLSKVPAPTVRENLNKRKNQSSLRLPLLDENGNVTNWSNQMLTDAKDNILNRNTLFDDVLSKYAGSTFNKSTTEESNRKVILAAKKEFDENYAKRPQSYTLIGPKSTDKESRDLWNMLPTATKVDVQTIYGVNGMWVRRDTQDILFGYSKMSLGNLFAKDAFKDLNPVETLLATVFTKIMITAFKGEAALKTFKYERAWIELVQDMKDIIVVKTFIVTAGNWAANQYMLKLAGVSFTDMAKYQAAAMSGATAYRADKAKLNEYKIQLESGIVKSAQEIARLKRDISILEIDLENNPVTELIDNGLMPSIIEDLTDAKDEFDFKSDLTKKAEKLVSKIPKKALDAAKVAVMAHDTKWYQAASRAAQLSDFVARYALYQHSITKKDPLTKAEAIIKTRDTFINYDIPMQRGIQYLDDAGLIIFTKYFLRIQRVFLQNMRENPLGWLTLGLLDSYNNLPYYIDESFATSNIGDDPFRGGALMLPNAIPKIATFALLDGITPDILGSSGLSEFAP